MLSLKILFFKWKIVEFLNGRKKNSQKHRYNSEFIAGWIVFNFLQLTAESAVYLILSVNFIFYST